MEQFLYVYVHCYRFVHENIHHISVIVDDVNESLLQNMAIVLSNNINYMSFVLIFHP